MVSGTGPICLVVEDQAPNLMSAMMIAEEAGFDVIQAFNGDDALRLLEARTDITVVFTDIVLPGTMDGLALAQAVRTGWPSVRILIVSGKLDIDPAALPPGAVFMPKPYEAGAVEDALRGFLPA